MQHGIGRHFIAVIARFSERLGAHNGARIAAGKRQFGGDQLQLIRQIFGARGAGEIEGIIVDAKIERYAPAADHLIELRTLDRADAVLAKHQIARPQKVRRFGRQRLISFAKPHQQPDLAVFGFIGIEQCFHAVAEGDRFNIEPRICQRRNRFSRLAQFRQRIKCQIALGQPHAFIGGYWRG